MKTQKIAQDREAGLSLLSGTAGNKKRHKLNTSGKIEASVLNSTPKDITVMLHEFSNGT